MRFKILDSRDLDASDKSVDCHENPTDFLAMTKMVGESKKVNP